MRESVLVISCFLLFVILYNYSNLFCTEQLNISLELMTKEIFNSLNAELPVEHGRLYE